MSVDGAFDEAVKAVSAVVHVASVLTFDKNPNKVVPQSVAGAMIALKAAAKEKGFKRFIYTSSSSASPLPKPNTKFHIDRSNWNDEAIKAAWAPPPYEEGKAWSVYAASKAEAETAIWNLLKRRSRSSLSTLSVLTPRPETSWTRRKRVRQGNGLSISSKGEGLDDMKYISTV